MYHSFEVELDDGRYFTAGATLIARGGVVEKVELDEIADGCGPVERCTPEVEAEVGAAIEAMVDGDVDLAYEVEEHDVEGARWADAERTSDWRRGH